MPAWQPVVAFACGAEDCSTSQCGTSQHSKATTKAESVADGCLACPPNRSDFGSICHPSSPDASSDCHSLDSTVLVRHHLSPTRAGRAKHLTERGGNGKTEPPVDVACSVHAQLDQDLKACPPKEGGHAPDLGWICDVLTTGAEDFRPHVQVSRLLHLLPLRSAERNAHRESLTATWQNRIKIGTATRVRTTPASFIIGKSFRMTPSPRRATGAQSRMLCTSSFVGSIQLPLTTWRTETFSTSVIF
jgi:hypothetical protein